MSSLKDLPGKRLSTTVIAVVAAEGIIMASTGYGIAEAFLDAAVVGLVAFGCGSVLMAKPLRRALIDIDHSRARLSSMFEHAPLGVVVARTDGRIEQANPAFTRMTGYSEIELIGLGWGPITHPDDLRRNEERAAAVQRGDCDHYRLQKRYLRKDGTQFQANLTVTSLPETQVDGVPRLIAMIEDVTERHRADQLRRLAVRVFNASGEAMLVTDSNSRIQRVNRAFKRVTGYGPRDVIGKTPKILSSGRHDSSFYEQLWGKIRQDGEWAGQVWNRRKDGKLYLQHLFITMLREADGLPSHYIGAFADVTEFHEKLEEASFRANHDPATGLPNRRLLLDRLAQAIEIMKREGKELAVLFLDLDGFKAINDGLGHAAGDQVLTIVADRLRQQVRSSDTVARFAGDEFVVIALDVGDATAAGRLAEKILAAVSAPMRLDSAPDRETSVGVSIGIARCPTDAAEPISLLGQADTAMYAAKRAGRGQWRAAGAASEGMDEPKLTRLCGRLIQARRLGVRQVDASHAAAVALVNHLSDLLRSAERETLPETLTALYNAMRCNLAAEEVQLERVGCPRLPSHCAEHEELIGGIDALLNDPERGWEDKAECSVRRIKEWLQAHHAACPCDLDLAVTASGR